MPATILKKSTCESQNFYGRPLPSLCVSFSSNEGKLLFKEAMIGGKMENYFRLASQLRTQDELAFCGLSTLVMCLNTLAVDPGRVWKGPWRWYHEHMLDCCIPLESIKKNGITLDQFICIAKCNGLRTDVKKMSEPQNFEDFRKLLLRITQKDDEILVVSYSRRLLMQTGDGHYAPIGGFNEEKDMVLLFDTARFKYPTHWVPIRTLWEAMFAIDNVTGKSRGYVTLSKDIDYSSLQVLATSSHLNEYLLTRKKSDPLANVIQDETLWLKGEIKHDCITPLSLIEEYVERTLNDYFNILELGDRASYVLTCHNTLPDDMSTETNSIIKEIVDNKIGLEVSNVINKLTEEQMESLSENVFLVPKWDSCPLLFLKDPRIKITFLVTSWLLINVRINAASTLIKSSLTRGSLLNELVSSVFQNEFSIKTQSELNQLCDKLKKLQRCKEMLCSQNNHKNVLP